MERLIKILLSASILIGLQSGYAQPGTIDYSFTIGAGANNVIYTMALQSDSKIIIGGNFTNYNGTGRNRIARLNTNGTLDATFNVGVGCNLEVYASAIQADGKILIAGNFTDYNGNPRNRIVRLNTDGTLDATFSIGSGFNDIVYAIAVQSDGKIVVGGNFTSYNATARSRIARLNADGSLDTGFSPSLNNTVRTISIQSDGKILAGGDFTLFNIITSSSRIIRLNTDGTRDVGFSIGTGFNNTVHSILWYSGGILVGGDFTLYNGTGRNRAIRLNTTDASIDATFNIGTGFNGTVYAFTIQSGRIVVGGDFTTYNSSSLSRIVRLLSNGTPDVFHSGAGFNLSVRALQVQASLILAAGNFTSYDFVTRNRIVRLNTSCPTATISPLEIPCAEYNIPYSVSFFQSGYTSPAWSIIGTLPPGLTFNPTTATISGTTTDLGAASFFVQISSYSCSHMQPYRIFYSQMQFNQIAGSPFTTGTILSVLDAKTGDFNKDGILDVIYSTNLTGPNALRIKLGNETGTFPTAPLNISVSDSTKAIDVFDINQDGLLDAIVTTPGMSSASYLKGSYAPPFLAEHQSNIFLGSPALISGIGMNDAVLADMDNDKDMDLVTAGIMYDGTNFYISLRVAFYDKTTDTFGSPVVSNVLISAPSPNQVYLDVGDIDNDGFADVAVATNKASTHPIWFRNNGGTSFTNYNIVAATTFSGGIRQIKVADFNNDGRKDVVIIANNTSRDIFRYYVNNGGALPSRFNTPSNLPPGDFDIPLSSFRKMIIGDFDNDKDLDIALSSAQSGTYAGGKLTIIRNAPTGSFQLDTYQNNYVFSNPFAIASGDFNRDGRPDITVFDRTATDRMYVFLNNSASSIVPRIGNFALKLRSAMNERGETNEAVITQNNNFTVEGWVNLSRHSANQYVFYNGNFGANGFGLYVPANTRELHLISHNAGTPTDINARAYPSGEDFEDGTWNHFALGRKATGEWFFFWNGNNDSLAIPTPPTHTFTPALPTNRTFLAWNGSTGTLLGRGSLDELRFWNTTLTQAEVQEWINLKATKDHPQAVNIAAHYDFNVSPTASATIAFDESEKIYPASKKKNATFTLAYPATLDSNWTKKIPPVANFGSSRSLYVDNTNQASVLDYDPQTGIQILFNSTIHPTGWIVVTRALEHPTDFPNPDGIPKVYWTIRNYGTPKIFDPLEMLRVRLTQLQCDSAKTSAIPLPNAGNYMNYFLAKRKSNSNNPSDWQIIGPANAYGTLQYRRPSSTINEFGRTLETPNNNPQAHTKPITTFSQLVPIHSLTPLYYENIDLEGRKVTLKSNQLRWKHDMPLRVKELYIQKSADAISFKTIGSLKVKNPNEFYTFSDNDALQAAYYRIHYQNGENMEYSNTIFIDKFKQSTPFAIYPNPASTNAEMQISGIAETGKWIISDITGLKLLELEAEVETFEKILSAFVSKQVPGMYVITYSNAIEKKSAKLVIR